MHKNKFCKVSGKCGGCQLSNMDYERQLKFKQAKVQKQIGRYSKVTAIISMNSPYHYRNKTQSVFFRNKSNALVSGVYQSSTGKTIQIDNCMLQTDTANKILTVLCKLFKSFKIEPYNYKTGRGYLRSVLIREGFATGEVMVAIIGNSPIFPAKKTFTSALIKACPYIKSLEIRVNNDSQKLFAGKCQEVLYGSGYIKDILCGLEFQISASSFYQVNPLQTEILYNKAIEFANLDGTQTVLDAYCGIGTISLIASQKAKEVIGFEINSDAIKDAKINAKLNNITNVEFYNADAKNFLRALIEDNKGIDVAFVDPPRAGCNREFLKDLCSLSPNRIVYISCNLETLSRDLYYLTNNGYNATKAQPVDLFPHTSHIESVVLLTISSE